MTTFTQSLRLAQMITGDPAVKDQWGTIWDSTVGAVEQAITGNGPIAIDGLTSYTLTVANNAPDQARQFYYPFIGVLSAPCQIVFPGIPKVGLASNMTTGFQSITLTTGAVGAESLMLLENQSAWFTCDGTNITVAGANPATVGVPIGSLMQYAGATAPPLWLLCYGQAISRATYALLFSSIGTIYGAGDGSGLSFNLPDLRGRAMYGLDNMGGAAAGRVNLGGSGIPGTTLGGAGGNQVIQGHSHSITDVSHNHDIIYKNFAGSTVILGPNNIGGPYDPSPQQGTVQGDASLVNQLGISSSPTGITGTNVTGTGASQNMPPALMVNTIIYAGV